MQTWSSYSQLNHINITTGICKENKSHCGVKVHKLRSQILLRGVVFNSFSAALYGINPMDKFNTFIMN